MDREYLSIILEKTAFPPEAKASVFHLADRLETRIDSLMAHFEENYDHQATNPLVEALGEQTKESPYSIWLLLLLLAAKKARPLFPSEEAYWDTFCDLRYKALECHDVHGIWGTFVAHWYPRFYLGNLIKLGRLEYESRPCPLSEPVTVCGITVNPGDPVFSLHIPSSGEPFDLNARVDSYRKAAAHFGKPLICLCNSWLLYEDYKNVFSPGSNCLDFMDDFYMLRQTRKEQFSMGWRIFGGGWTQDCTALPENTSMQRAFKTYLQAGGTGGSGLGLLIFDGEKLLTRKVDT